MRIPELKEMKAYLLAPGPALHALRTAVAASVTFVLTHVLGLEQGYWAVFSSILVMQANIGSSLSASRARPRACATWPPCSARSWTAA